MRIQVVLTLPRESVSVPLARHTVAAALQSAGITQDCLAEVEVALSEACTNVFHHADAGESYEVAINIGDEQLTIEVVDSGEGIGWRPHDTSMPSVMAEGGRGLALMTALTDHALFDSVTGEGGSVHLTKRLHWTKDAPLAKSVDGAVASVDSAVDSVDGAVDSVDGAVASVNGAVDSVDGAEGELAVLPRPTPLHTGDGKNPPPSPS